MAKSSKGIMKPGQTGDTMTPSEGLRIAAGGKPSGGKMPAGAKKGSKKSFMGGKKRGK